MAVDGLGEGLGTCHTGSLSMLRRNGVGYTLRESRGVSTPVFTRAQRAEDENEDLMPCLRLLEILLMLMTVESKVLPFLRNPTGN